MSEINCLVIFNNTSQFELNMDSKVTFGMVNDQIRKNFHLPDNVPLQFSYLDNEDDAIRVSSELEFREFLEYASNLEFITLLVTSEVQLPESIPVPPPAIIEAKVPQEESKQVEELKEPNFNIKYQIPLIRRNRRMNAPINNGGAKVQIARAFRVICDHCQEEITNLRYKCLQCPDYDLCEKCEDLKCKQENNQIHPDDHIFAKIRDPIHRPVPNNFAHRRHLHRFSAPRCPRIHSTLLNNNNNNNNQANTTEVNNNNNNPNNNNNNERRKEWGQRFHQRGQRIKELEDRVQVLEQEISQILSTLRSSSPVNNENNDHRKYWAFQC